MSTTNITSFNVLQPKVVRTIREAYDEAVRELEARRGELPKEAQAKVARRIVELARHGECDLQRLRAAALTAVPL
jgi:hypothetical protein